MGATDSRGYDMQRKRLLALLASAALVALPTTSAVAQTIDTTTDTPTADTSSTSAADEPVQTDTSADDETDGADDSGSSSSATAAQVDGVVEISSTEADTSGDGSASSTPVGIGGETLLGGSQDGDGSSSGEAATTGENEQGELTIGQWSAAVENGEAESESSLVYGRLADVLWIELLQSYSQASEDGSHSETTGATADAGDGQLHVEVLHSESSSDGEGTSYLASINGNEIGSSEQADGQCEIPADPVLHVNCLEANEWDGSQDLDGDGEPDGQIGADATVADADVGDGALTGEVFAAEAAEGPSEPDDEAPAPDTAPAPEPDTSAPAPDVESGTLPRTGGGATAAVAGLGLLGSAAALERWKN